jgi:hypothetical protein
MDSIYKLNDSVQAFGKDAQARVHSATTGIMSELEKVQVRIAQTIDVITRPFIFNCLPAFCILIQLYHCVETSTQCLFALTFVTTLIITHSLTGAFIRRPPKSFSHCFIYSSHAATINTDFDCINYHNYFHFYYPNHFINTTIKRHRHKRFRAKYRRQPSHCNPNLGRR